jgi:hypothetical protein
MFGCAGVCAWAGAEPIKPQKAAVHTPAASEIKELARLRFGSGVSLDEEQGTLPICLSWLRLAPKPCSNSSPRDFYSIRAFEAGQFFQQSGGFITV